MALAVTSVVGRGLAVTQSATGLPVTAVTSGGLAVTPVAAGGLPVFDTAGTLFGPAVIPANTVLPVISGTPQVGNTLLTSSGTWSGTTATYTYQWKRGGANIAGATSSSYLLVTADLGTTITVTVTATNTAGSASATAAGVGPVVAAPVAPANTVLPAISGSLNVGSVLTTTTGTWTGTATITYTYQWQRGGSNVAGATASSYTLVTADIAAMMTVVVTATNSVGNASATSAAVGPVTAVAAFTLSGDVKSGAFAYWSTARAYNAAAASGLFNAMDLVDQAGAHPVTIKVKADGRVDVAAINTWVTANSVTTIKVAQLYDQTGNNRHVSQATLANMPVLKLSHPGLGDNAALPVLDFVYSANMSLVSGATGLSTSTGTFSMIARAELITQSTASGGFMGLIQAGANGPCFYGTANTLCMYNGVIAQYLGALSDNFHALQYVFNGASSVFVVNGIASPATDAGTGTLGTPFTFGKLINSNPLMGNISEIRFDNSVWTPTDCTNEYTSQKTFWFNNTAYEGIVASRCRRRETFDATNKYANTRSAHIASQAITQLKALFTNTGGGPLTLAASVEYPAGTFTQMKFLGANSILLPNPFEYFSDYTTVSIPNGATFWIRQFIDGSGGGALNYNTWQNTFLGEAAEVSASVLTNKTMSGTIANSGSPSGISNPPTLIVGLTTQPSAIVVGDSIGVGFFDVEDTSNTATGYNNVWGYINKSLAAMNVPFANYAVTTSQAANRSPSLAMGKCSHLVSEFGINDLDIGGASSATLIASIAAFAKFTAPYAKLYQSTILPHTTSPNGFIAPQDQVANNATTDANRVAFNNALRAGTTGIVRLTNYINSAGVAESAVNSNKWTVAGSPPYTTDGLHPNTDGHNLMTGTIPAMTYP